MKMIPVFLLVVFLACSSGLAQTSKVGQEDIDLLLEHMTGEFSSEELSKTDSLIFHISLRMAQIWHESDNGYWLYVEQAMADSEEAPYRQRIYHLTIYDEYTISSTVFEIPQPSVFVGGWKNPEFFEQLSPAALELREGCAIFLKKMSDNHFYGQTNEDDCLSAHRGATYATSEVNIWTDRIETWDRGWNDLGEQVWGTTHRGYVFDKVRN